MGMRIQPIPLTSLSLMFCILAWLAGCGGSRDETIAGVKVPVPNGMTNASAKPTEVSLLGFGAGQAIFHGNMDADRIVKFYKEVLPARGWQSNMNLRSGGAMLAYSKEGKTLLIGVTEQEGKTNLSLTIGGVR
jgi:hypothetical protein